MGSDRKPPPTIFWVSTILFEPVGAVSPAKNIDAPRLSLEVERVNDKVLLCHMNLLALDGWMDSAGHGALLNHGPLPSSAGPRINLGMACSVRCDPLNASSALGLSPQPYSYCLNSVSAVPKAPVWLARSNRCKTGPSKAVAGRSVVSVA